MKYGIRASLVSATAIAAAVCGLTLASPSTSWAQAPTYPFDIPAEDGAKALNDFSRQSGVQLLFPYDLAAKANVPGLKGTYTRQEALNTLLAATGLEVASQTDETISLRVKERPGTTGSGDPAETPTEVIVTGTHIRGGNPTAPVHTVTRGDIEASGYTQLGDVIHSLPENFGGGQNPGIIGASRVNINNQNYSNETTVNLRGLGADATLTLLNGHRLSSDGYFQGADISGIPLAAVQRVEIVADGTSALYGSEAVAGVANVILRKTYNGAQVSASYGAATQGGGASRTVNALVGAAGANGYLLGNIEYQKSDGIFASQRSATSGVKPQTTLLQPQTRKSAFLAGGRDLTDRLSIAFDALVSDPQQPVRPAVSKLRLHGQHGYARLFWIGVGGLPADRPLAASRDGRRLGKPQQPGPRHSGLRLHGARLLSQCVQIRRGHSRRPCCAPAGRRREGSHRRRLPPRRLPQCLARGKQLFFSGAGTWSTSMANCPFPSSHPRPTARGSTPWT